MTALERTGSIKNISAKLAGDFTLNEIRSFFQRYLIEPRTIQATSKGPYCQEALSRLQDSQIQSIAAELNLGEDRTVEERLAPPVIPTASGLDIFISHSSKDVDVAEALINLLRSSMNIPSERIRCTSVNGYRLPGGAKTDEQLRAEVVSARVFVGIITQHSLQSAFVMFELGARWGGGQFFLPLMAKGFVPRQLSGPLTGINALDCRDAAQIVQMLEDIARKLELRLDSHSSFQGHVERVRAAAGHSENDVDVNPSKPSPAGSAAVNTALYDDSDCLALISRYISEKLREGRGGNLHYADVDKDLGLTPGTTFRLLEIAAKSAGYLINHKGSNVVSLSRQLAF